MSFSAIKVDFPQKVRPGHMDEHKTGNLGGIETYQSCIVSNFLVIYITKLLKVHPIKQNENLHNNKIYINTLA